MKLKIVKGNIKKQLIIPTSKSWANRFLIIGAIQKGESIIENISPSTDVKNLLDAFSQLGLKTEFVGKTVKIKNSFPECESDIANDTITLRTGDGGTTNRFLLALLSRGKKRYQIITSIDFAKRPNDDLFNVLLKNGVDLKIGKGTFWVEVCGNGGIPSKQIIDVDCEKSTQFLSGLMLSYADRENNFSPKNINSSGPYIKMTEKVIEYYISGASRFVTPVDFSSLGYPVAFICDGGKIEILNCDKVDEFQADSYLMKFLEKKGVCFSFGENGLRVDASKFDYQPFSQECSGFPDLVPTLAFIACLCRGESRLSGLDVLKHKESNRFDVIYRILQSSGVEVISNALKDEMKINGPCLEIKDFNISLPPDHRMVMLAAMLIKKFGCGEIDQVHHVNKSYPSFFEDFNL